MKKLITVLLMVIAIDLSAQTIVIDPDQNSVSVDTAGSLYPVVSRVNPTTTSLPSAKQDTTKRIVVWLEPGDGSFSTEPSVSHTIISTPPYSSFLLATNLYDTGKGGVDKSMPSRVLFKNKMNVTTPGTRNAAFGFTELLLNEYTGVKLQSNINSIVPGDSMVFAITYKTASKDPIPGNYKLYFFYNDNATFISLDGTEHITSDLPFVRVHNVETPIPLSANPFSDEVTQQKGFANYLGFNIGAGSNKVFEHTIFISMIPKDTLTYGESGSVYAVLTDERGNKIASDSIGKMLFAPAHDPNYLVQSPSCIDLPKHNVPFSYHVHFQNTGEGPANKVRLRIQLPEGLDWSTFKLESAFYAGNNYPLNQLTTIPADPKNNTTDSLVVLFSSADAYHYLEGRTVSEPATNPHTMGDIYFSITATSQVKDSMQAYANIDFLSANTQTPGVYEQPVKTNVAITRYKEHCVDCKKCVPCCYHILSLCWWWWLIILAIIIIIIIVIKRRRKKLQAC